MKSRIISTALVLALTYPAAAQQAQRWSVGVGTGAFVFGDFVERKVRPTTGEGSSGTITMALSGRTRPGLSVNVQRDLSDRWALRLEGTFTHAPLAVRQKGSEGVALDAGALDVATFMLPLVFNVNRHGAFRVHVMAGPADATYHIKRRANASSTVPLFEGTRSEWGGAAGVGLGWSVSPRFEVEGNLTDILTTSPFHDSDFPDVPGFRIRKPHNVHTTVGVRWRF